MELSKEIKDIAEFWLGFDFLKKYKDIGSKYMEQIEEEKNGRKASA